MTITHQHSRHALQGKDWRYGPSPLDHCGHEFFITQSSQPDCSGQHCLQENSKFTKHISGLAKSLIYGGNSSPTTSPSICNRYTLLHCPESDFFRPKVDTVVRKFPWLPLWIPLPMGKSLPSFCHSSGLRVHGEQVHVWLVCLPDHKYTH